MLLSGLFLTSPGYAQHKAACELVGKADAEAVLGTTLLAPAPTEPFRSLLDPDNTTGTPDQGCSFANFKFNYATPNAPRPPKVIHFSVEVRYSATPDPGAIDKARKEVDQRTYEHPTDVAGVGDAAFSIGHGENLTLFVFAGGTTRLLIGPGNIDLEQEKALAVKALAALGGKPSLAHAAQPAQTSRPAAEGTSPATAATTKPATAEFTKPVLANPGPNSSAVDKLKRALTAKSESGDARAALALGRLYEVGALAADGSAVHDYAGAAYWYHQASDHGQPQASYELARLYHDGLGVAANSDQSFALLRKAADANYVPAMSPLSDAYADQKTATSGQRATYWAMRAAEAGDSRGWLTLGFEWNAGKLGGDPPYTYHSAMEAWQKAAAGGNCVAMLEIGELFSTGHGVRADKTQAQNWNAKALACHDGNVRTLQQQATTLRERAAAARDPLLSAIPRMPTLTIGAGPGTARGNGREPSANTKFMVGVVAVIAGVIALAALSPPQPDAHDGAIPGLSQLDMDVAAQKLADQDCLLGGGIPGLFQCIH